MIHQRLLVRAQCDRLESTSIISTGQSIPSCTVAESIKEKGRGRAARRKYLWDGLAEAKSVLFSVLERGQ